ncbi:MAG: VOC family protein [Candidatus Devosia phytovorans]|uniref:VOC family protein n=1 Tax=Candidatus Devosia phytovorans TaxID=3121372 RepID=A0AAJ5VZC8_9HYPH|nr:VOC family protein [Devosia sp.]WEK06303.1 MAG: VOC family protein [Devosia sp.]
MALNEIEVITLLADDIAATKAFYHRVFKAESLFADAVSEVLRFGGLIVNLLQATQGPELVTPIPVAPAVAGVRMMLTIKVENVDATCAELEGLGVALLNGPIDRPWGRRTAAFADPAGHVWEVAQEIG